MSQFAVITLHFRTQQQTRIKKSNENALDKHT